MLLHKRKKRALGRTKRGQGITEYGAMLAFVAVLVALCFGIANGTLAKSVQAAFSSISSQLNSMSTAAGGAS